jgi:hypothetical protein
MNTILLVPIYKEWRILLVRLSPTNQIQALKLLGVYPNHQHDLALQNAEEEAKKRGLIVLTNKINIS